MNTRSLLYINMRKKFWGSLSEFTDGDKQIETCTVGE